LLDFMPRPTGELARKKSRNCGKEISNNKKREEKRREKKGQRGGNFRGGGKRRGLGGNMNMEKSMKRINDHNISNERKGSGWGKET